MIARSSVKYVAVVLSITISDANAGTEMFDAIGNAFEDAVTTALPATTPPLV